MQILDLVLNMSILTYSCREWLSMPKDVQSRTVLLLKTNNAKCVKMGLIYINRLVYQNVLRSITAKTLFVKSVLRTVWSVIL